ncbi:MAG TPA: response regulator [Opitutaceae bacterium]|nr:response regulator [Opitutaceae bacterium]
MSEAQLQKLRVLLVEDNAEDAELVVRELKHAGFDPQWQRVATEAAFQTALDKDWDVVLSDFVIPQFGGERALALLQAAHRDVPFILISGTMGEEVAVAAMREGAADYLLKDRLARLGPAIRQAMERRTLEERFLHAQRMEAIGTLAAGVAHDLNNILTPMLMAAGILRETLKDPKDRHVVSLVEQGAQRGAGIVRQLLTFSRGMAGARISVQVRHLLKEIENIVHETFPKNIAIQRHGPVDLWTVKADATQLHQVLLNLCVNARDAMPSGGRLTLEADNCVLTEAEARADPLAKPGPYLRIIVADTGHGIPPDIIKRIFDPFFTTKGVGKGTGLGLSTVMGIVKNHGGFVHVYSEPGRGASFRIYLPAEPSSTAASPPPAELPAARGTGELILVVDDESGIREMARHILESHGYRVVTAANGEEAVNCYLEHREQIRLILTDMMMPVMDGPSLIRALRILDTHLRVAPMSGLEHAQRDAELAGMGLEEILIKPFDARSLLERVRRRLASG